MRKRGFTLIELLVVIAIIAILAILIIVNVSSARLKAQDSKVKADCGGVSKAAEMQLADNGAITGVGVQAVQIVLTSAMTYTFTDTVGTTHYMATAPTHPISTVNYKWRTNAGGTAYIVTGQLATTTTSFFHVSTGGVASTGVEDVAP